MDETNKYKTSCVFLLSELMSKQFKTALDAEKCVCQSSIESETEQKTTSHIPLMGRTLKLFIHSTKYILKCEMT